MVIIEDTAEEVKRAITGKDYGILVEVSTREGLRSMPELRFVATVMTGGRVKFVLAVYIFLENNAISRIICVELQNLHTPSVILH